MTTTAYTIELIRQEMRADGSHWWDRDTMRFFRCRISSGVFQGEGGIYFVSSEKSGDTAPRMYTVRKYDPTAKSIDTVGEFNAIRSLSTAKRKAEKLAGAPMQVEPPLVEETAAEAFARTLTVDGGCKCSHSMAAYLIRLAKRHHDMCEDACNEPGMQIYDEDDNKAARVEELEVAILKAGHDIHARGILFDYDPRGCTVKIVCPNGFTNDWGKEGVCVPIFAD